MSTASPIERRLLRISFVLKISLWIAIAATLAVGIWDVATGRLAGPPTVLIWIIGILIVLQAFTLFAWYRLWKARLRNARPGKGAS